MHHKKLASVFILCVGMAVSGGCATTTPKPLPAWLIHVPRQDTQAVISLEGSQQRLVEELGSSTWSAGHIPPEQLARFALQLVDDGNPLDAAVFLAASSYTYHRQADFAVREAERTAPSHLARATPQGVSAFREFVRDEYRTFRDLNFEDALDITMALWERKKKVFEQFDEEWKQVSGSFGVSSAERQNAIREEMMRKLETARLPEWDKLKYPVVAKALLERLKADLADRQFNFNAGLHLAAVPFKSWLLTGLNNAPDPFMVPLCRSIGLRFAAFEEDILAALHSSSPNVRSNAALILGLRGGKTYVESIDAAYQAETDRIVTWSMEYALIVALDDDARKKEMIERFAGHTPEASGEKQIEHLILLYEWLPAEALSALDTQWLHKIAKDDSNSKFVRAFALMTLGQIGRNAPIGTDTLQMMLAYTEDADKDFAEWAHNSVVQLQSLSKKNVKVMLSQNAVGRDALLDRMLALAEPADFDFWQEQAMQFARLSDLGKRITIWGLRETGKNNAEPALNQLFLKQPDIRLDIAMAYAGIPQVGKEQLRTLAANDGGAAGTFLLFAADQRNEATQRLGIMLHSNDFQEKLTGARLAKMFFVKEHRIALQHNADYFDAAYYPNDAVLRNRQLDALLTISVYQAFQRVKNEFSAPVLRKK